MGNIGSLATVVLLVVLFLGGITVISEDISKNDNLDSNSISLLTRLGAEYDNNYDSATVFETAESNITANSTFAGVDAFARQYLEDKSETDERQGTISKVLGFPSLILVIFGVTNNLMLILWNTAVYGFLGFMIGLYIYKAIRTGEVD